MSVIDTFTRRGTGGGLARAQSQSRSTTNTTVDSSNTNKRTTHRWAGAMVVVPLVAVGASSMVMITIASADQQHTVTFEVTGPANAFSADGMWKILITVPNHPEEFNTKLPWTKTYTVQGSPTEYLPLAVRITPIAAGAVQCTISVDGSTHTSRTTPDGDSCISSVPPGDLTSQNPAGNVPSGPDSCKQGYVWRDAQPGDHVCVTSQIRTDTAQENSQAATRRNPNGGPYGPDTCLQGFVWREAFPDDHVCVTPDSRARAATDNAAAASHRN